MAPVCASEMQQTINEAVQMKKRLVFFYTFDQYLSTSGLIDPSGGNTLHCFYRSYIEIDKVWRGLWDFWEYGTIPLVALTSCVLKAVSVKLWKMLIKTVILFCSKKLVNQASIFIKRNVRLISTIWKKQYKIKELNIA